jgi:RNA polymerase sigma-70 factor (ECF subfamily)
MPFSPSAYRQIVVRGSRSLVRRFTISTPDVFLGVAGGNDYSPGRNHGGAMFERRGRSRSPNPDSEAELLRALSEGSEAAMAALYQLHGSLIYRFCLRMCQDESIAEEVTQDVFVALLKQAGRFDAKRATLSTWLCGIARRLVWTQMERQSRYSPLPAFEERNEIESPEDDPGVVLSRKEAVQAVQRGLDELPLDLKAVIVLCEFEEMKYEDAALVLGVPVGTVRSRLHRAKGRLAGLLHEDRAAGRKDISL